MSCGVCSDGVVGLLAGVIALGPLSTPVHSQAVASAPAATASAKTKTRVERIELSAGFYLLRKPVGYRPSDRPPLIVCLHETETGAATILAFWRRLKTPIGMVLAAPEHHMPGWRDTDLPCVRAMMAHLDRHVTYDPQRVLLTGYSAGGAVACHLVYAERFEAPAVAATANYVRPSVTGQLVAARSDVPIFYAVGMRDINHDRMRASIELLQANGGPLTLLRPNIGHRLDPAVGQRAMDWFVKTTTKQSTERIDQARRLTRDKRYAAGLALVEPILAQRRWHPPDVVARAEPVRVELERPGRQRLIEADRLARQGNALAAVDVLQQIKTAYGTARLAIEAQERRRTLLADPKVRSAQLARQAEQREQAGRQALIRTQRLVLNRQYDQAKEQCRAIIQMYPGSNAAARAQTLLDQLRRSGK